MRIINVALVVFAMIFTSSFALSAPLPSFAIGATATPQSAPQAVPAAPAAGNVVWSIPYQLTSASACVATGCVLHFGLVGAKQRLDIKFVSCLFGGATGLQVGGVALGIGNANLKPRHFLEGSHHDSGTTTYFVVSNPVVFSVPAGKRPNIAFNITGTITIDPECTIAGVLNGVS